jgi:hypothetical protein
MMIIVADTASWDSEWTLNDQLLQEKMYIGIYKDTGN